MFMNIVKHILFQLVNNLCFRLKKECITGEITIKNAGLILNVIFKHHQMGLSVNNMQRRGTFFQKYWFQI